MKNFEKQNFEKVLNQTNKQNFEKQNFEKVLNQYGKNNKNVIIKFFIIII